MQSPLRSAGQLSQSSHGPGKIARAYPVRAIGEGLLRDEIDGEVIALAFVPASGSLRVVEAPARARVVYTFWFAWAAFHPDTEIYGSDG